MNSGLLTDCRFGVRPLVRGENFADNEVFAALFSDPQERLTYALVDAALVPDLEQRLEAHPGRATCLVEGPDSAHLAWALPWLIEIGPDDRLTKQLLSDLLPNGLWNRDCGIFLETNLEPPVLMRHLRKFHRPRIDTEKPPVFLRFWEPELLVAMIAAGCTHVQALPRPDLRIVARFDTELHILSRKQESTIRPGRITKHEADMIGKLLICRRRREIANKISATFPNETAHLTPRAMEREVYDAWQVANDFRLNDGEVRAMFIIMAVALAPGLHREPAVEHLFAASSDPDRTFRDLDQVIRRQIGRIPIGELS